eukprot:6767786-Prymnesium_polylepis.3
MSGAAREYARFGLWRRLLDFGGAGAMGIKWEQHHHHQGDKKRRVDCKPNAVRHRPLGLRRFRRRARAGGRRLCEPYAHHGRCTRPTRHYFPPSYPKGLCPKPRRSFSIQYSSNFYHGTSS